jgi:hypothetical protein
MNDGPWKFHRGYLVEGLDLFTCKVAYTKYDAAVLVRWSNYNMYYDSFDFCHENYVRGSVGQKMFIVFSVSVCNLNDVACELGELSRL